MTYAPSQSRIFEAEATDQFAYRLTRLMYQISRIVIVIGVVVNFVIIRVHIRTVGSVGRVDGLKVRDLVTLVTLVENLTRLRGLETLRQACMISLL